MNCWCEGDTLSPKERDILTHQKQSGGSSLQRVRLDIKNLYNILV
jgi:hypothetical protein